MRSFLKYLTTALILIGMLGVPVELPGNIRTATEEADTKSTEENSIVVSQLRFTSFLPGKKKNTWAKPLSENTHAKIAPLSFFPSSSLFLLYRSILI
jgi:hypothetical protein